MDDGSAPPEPDKVIQFVQRHWKTCVALIWLAMAAWLIITKWKAIGWYALPDTDDNIRMAQVRGLLHGQGWYDLRQYKLDPPRGASILLFEPTGTLSVGDRHESVPESVDATTGHPLQGA